MLKKAGRLESLEAESDRQLSGLPASRPSGKKSSIIDQVNKLNAIHRINSKFRRNYLKGD